MLFLTSNECFQPLMLIVPDIQDVYTPLQSDVIVQLSEVSVIMPFKNYKMKKLPCNIFLFLWNR